MQARRLRMANVSAKSSQRLSALRSPPKLAGVRTTSSGECKFDLRRGSAQIHCRCGTSARRIGWLRARLTTGHASDAGPACPVRRAVPGVAQ